MIHYADEYSRMVVSRTLAHMTEVEREVKDHRTFQSYILQWMGMPHQDVRLAVNRGNVSESGIAIEIDFGWFPLTDAAVNYNPSEQKLELTGGEVYWYDYQAERSVGRPMIGALINHGTDEEPSWSSHT